MPTRRRTLALAGGLLSSLTGCLQDDEPSGADGGTPSGRSNSPTQSPAPAGTPTVAGTDRPDGTAEETGTETRTATGTQPTTVTRVTNELPEWTADAWIETGSEQVLSLDAAGDRRLYVTMDNEGSESAVAALSPGGTTFDWQTSMRGDAEGRTAVNQTDWTGQWGVAVADGSVYSVHGLSQSYDWSTVHALDATTGTRQWAFERDRLLGVTGFLEQAVVVRSTEYFEPEHAHDTPEEPLETRVHAVDRESGDSRWTVSVRGFSDLVTGSDGTYVAHERSLSAFGPGGEERWQTQFSAEVRSVTTVAGSLVLALGSSTDDSSLVGLSADGAVRWRRSISTRVLVPRDDRVYVMDDSVAAVTADGRIAWQVDAYGHYPLLSTDGSRLYTRTNAEMNAIDAYELPGGQRRFRFVTPSDNGWPVASTDETLVAEAITPEKADFTSLFAVDASTGEPQAVYRPADTVFSVTGFDGRVYGAFGNGRVGIFPNPG